SPDAEQIRILADSGLLKRALRNLIGNSIRHNPQGCMVRIRLSRSGSQVRWKISDTGRGIPETVVQNMDTQTEKVHIMGLRLARQIARAHGGDLVFCRRETGSYDVEMVLPDREN
ncbi:MAG TPA: ATP-binding protein, partial [Candidatus Blautia intestinipullorum]|nr:ATP-binding protein [Candidatus Blautia intestinipullorum]